MVGEVKDWDLEHQSSLDSCVPIELSRDTAHLSLEIMQAVAPISRDLLLDEIVEDHAPESATFNQLLAVETGNLMQRLTKLYIQPHNPQVTVKLLEQLGVDKFQKVALAIQKLLMFGKSPNTNPHSFEARLQNYVLPDTKLETMLDFATNRSTFNELFHLLGSGIAATLVMDATLAGNADATIVVNTGFFLLNTYAVLAQRYARARLVQTINRALKSHRPLDSNLYFNALHLVLPHHTK